MERNWLDITALILIIIGAINWGLIGFFEFDLISYFFGTLTAVTRIIFAVVGIAGIYSLILFLETQDKLILFRGNEMAPYRTKTAEIPLKYFCCFLLNHDIISKL